MDYASAIVNLSQGLTWKRALVIGLLIVFAVVGLLVFERYTNSFRLNRLQKAADVLAVLNEIEADTLDSSPAVERLHNEIAAELAEALRTDPPSLALPTISGAAPRHAAWLKLLFGAMPWLLLALVSLPSALRGSEAGLGGVIAFLFVGGFFGVLGLLIPAWFWPWLNLVVYPLVHPLLLVALLVIVGMKQTPPTPTIRY